MNPKFLDETPDAMEVEEKGEGGGREGGRGLGALISTAFRGEGRGGRGPGGEGGEDSLEARPLLGRRPSSARVRVSLASCFASLFVVERVGYREGGVRSAW